MGLDKLHTQQARVFFSIAPLETLKCHRQTMMRVFPKHVENGTASISDRDHRPHKSVQAAGRSMARIQVKQ